MVSGSRGTARVGGGSELTTDVPGPILRMYRDAAASRYVADLEGGERAVLDYRLEGDRILFTHTGTPVPYRGRGIAGALTEFALEDAIARGMRIAPYCSFTASYVRRHERYGAHLSEDFDL